MKKYDERLEALVLSLRRTSQAAREAAGQLQREGNPFSSGKGTDHFIWLLLQKMQAANGEQAQAVFRECENLAGMDLIISLQVPSYVDPEQKRLAEQVVLLRQTLMSIIQLDPEWKQRDQICLEALRATAPEGDDLHSFDCCGGNDDRPEGNGRPKAHTMDCDSFPGVIPPQKQCKQEKQQ